MTRAAAYRILGLKPGATEAEIRKQFKKLAFKVHPDVNPGEDANEQFILLTQAMEALMSPDVPHYMHEIHSRTEQRRNRQEETADQRAARMNEARERYESQKRRNAEEHIAYFRRLNSGPMWRCFRWIVRVAAVLIVVLALDAVLPCHYEKDELVAFSRRDYNGILSNKITSVDLKNAGSYFVHVNRGIWMTFYPDVTLKRTWILHTPVAFFSTNDFSVSETYMDFHIGSIRFGLIAILFFPLITYFRRKRDLLYVFIYQFSFWGVGLLELYLLLSQNRLVHLLTLGFL
jgi:hypothetical protein